MTSFKLVGAALIVAAVVAPASAQAISEPAAAAAQDPSFSIYSSGGAFGYRPPMAVQPFNPNAMAGMRGRGRPHRAYRAPIRRY